MAAKQQRGVMGSATSGTTLSCTFAGNPQLGSLICVAIYWVKTGSVAGTTIVSVLDENSNVYTVTPSSPSTWSSGAGQCFMAYLRSAPANAGKTITVTFADTQTNGAIWADEFSNGAAVFDSDGTGVGTGTTINTPTASVNSGDDLLYCIGGSAGLITSANLPWVGNEGGIQNGNFAAWILSTNAATALNFTQNNVAWTSMVMSFKWTGPRPIQGFLFGSVS